MTKTKNVKRTLFASAMCLILCFVMLLGTTYAWFTDSVTSAGNIIQSGTLDVTMEWAYGNTDPATTTWKDASEGPIFESKLWEPGYTEIRHIKIANAGTLALKYQLNIVANGEVSKLADVIDVYYLDPAEQIADRANIPADKKLGTLTDVLANISTTASGNLEAGKNHTITLALKMQENAGNEYQNLSIGSDFSVQLLATQLTAENDSFDNQYDLGATWLGTIPTSLEDTTLEIVPGGGTQTGTITVNSAEDLVYLNKLAQEWVSLYSNGQGTDVGSYRENVGGKGTDYYYHWKWAIELTTDLNMSNIPMDSVDISYWDDFDGNGHTISNVVLKKGQDGLFINGAKAINNLTVKNIKVNAPDAQTVGAVSGNGGMTNVHVVNATVTGGKYVGGICGKGGSFVNCSIKDSTIIGSDKTVGGLVGYSVGDPDTATVSGNIVDNVTVTGAYNVGGLLGQSQNETVENNTVKNVTVKSTLELPANASANEVRTSKLAARSEFANTVIGENTVENVTLIDVVNVTDNAGLQAAINSGATEIALGSGEYTFPASSIKAGSTLICAPDTVFDGKTGLNINGATVVGGTFTNDNGYLVNSTTVNGTFKDCVFTNCDGLRYCYAGETVVFENCVFDTDFYGVHFDGGTNDIIFKNCTFSGFNTFGSAVTKLTLEECTFKYNGKGGYNGINMWGTTDLINCTFVFDGSASNEWIDACGNNKNIYAKGCVISDGTTERELTLADIGDYGTGNNIVVE